jgi:hypothetical protein
MKCKVIGTKFSEKRIEENVNDWLLNNPNVQIKFITQGSVGSNFITTIFYE